MSVVADPGSRTGSRATRFSSHVVFFVLCVGATILTYQLHEFTHFLAGRLVGLDERYLFTGVQTLTPNPAAWQLLVKTAAGPLMTLAAALACLALTLRTGGRNALFLAATLETAFLRIQPMAFDLFGRFARTQDEFKIAEWLGLPGRSLMAVSLLVFLAVYIVALVAARRGRVGTVAASIAGAACGAILVSWVLGRLA